MYWLQEVQDTIQHFLFLLFNLYLPLSILESVDFAFYSSGVQIALRFA